MSHANHLPGAGAPGWYEVAPLALRHGGCLRFELFHCFDAAGANGRMLGVLADVGFPVPAAVAFLAVCVNPIKAKNDALFARLANDFKSELRYAQQFLKISLQFYYWRQGFGITTSGDFCF
jgi:hypothetical protein